MSNQGSTPISHSANQPPYRQLPTGGPSEQGSQLAARGMVEQQIPPAQQQQFLQPGRPNVQPQIQMGQFRPGAANPQFGNQGNPLFDYNRISDLTTKYPRQVIA